MRIQTAKGIAQTCLQTALARFEEAIVHVTPYRTSYRVDCNTFTIFVDNA